MVNTLAISDGGLNVGGQFTRVGGSSIAASRIAKWNATDGWSALGSGLNNPVNALALSGTDLYVGGAFTAAGDVSSRNYIAKWNTAASDNTGWSALGSWLNGPVYALAAADRQLYVGGSFLTTGGQFTPAIAAVDLCRPAAPAPASPSPPARRRSGNNSPCLACPEPARRRSAPFSAPTPPARSMPANTTRPPKMAGSCSATTSSTTAISGSPSPTLSLRGGHWLKSFAAPPGGDNLEITGTATPAPVSAADGCANTLGCQAITVTTVAGQDRYNLVGNPFPYNVDWTKVRVRLKQGETLIGVYTPLPGRRAQRRRRLHPRQPSRPVQHALDLWI